MHEQGGQTPTDCDEAIAAALGGQEEAGASADAKGGPHGGSRLDADGDVGPAAAAAEQQELEAPSAPPMPPFLREGASPGAQERAGQPAGSNAAHTQLDEDERLARSLHDEELRRLSEEQRGGWVIICGAPMQRQPGAGLTRSARITASTPVGQVPLPALSNTLVPLSLCSDAERLTSLPSLLSESALVRTLSDKLLQSVPLTKVRGARPPPPASSLLTPELRFQRFLLQPHGARFSRSPVNHPPTSLPQLLPRVNGPAAAGARAEPGRAGRARLEERLRLYCLTERQVKGDGACQFRALSDQLYRCEGQACRRRRRLPTPELLAVCCRCTAA